MGGRAAAGAAVAVWCGLLAGAGVPLAVVLPALVLLPPLALVAWRGPDRVGTLALLMAVVLAAAARGSASRAALERERACIGGADLVARIQGRVTEPPLRAAAEPLAV